MILKMLAWGLLCLVAIQPTQADTDTTLTPKSEGGAVGRSLAGTLIPWALSIPLITRDYPNSDWNEIAGVGLIAAGALIGPGLGHLYADNSKSFFSGLRIRALAGGVMVAGIANSESLFDANSSTEFLIVTGGIVVLVSAIIDIARADDSARKYNQDRGLSHVYVYPSWQIETGDVSLNLALRF